jgi:predicted ATPase
MLLTHVHIENFKRFETLDIDLEPFDCLVGPNNSGKTTLLQALALFDFCLHHCLNKKNGGFELKRRTIQPEEFYVLPVANPMDLWTDRKSMAGGKQNIIKICATFDRQREVTATVKLDFNRFGIGIESSEESHAWLQELAGFRIAYLPVFSMFLAQEERRTPAVIEDALARGRVHSVIRNLLLDLRSNQEYCEALVDVLKRAFPTLKNLGIEFDEVSDRYISVTYQESGRPKEFDVFSAGSGFQQFLYLFGFIHLRQPTTILLDEPDVHLHGILQNALLQELNRLVACGKQVLLATHSRELVGRISPQNIISLEDDRPRRLKVEFEVYDTLDRLGSIDPTQLSIIQAYQKVLIVEDHADKDLLGTFCSACLGAKTWQQVERRLAVCYAKGNPWKQQMARLREQLQQMISLEGRALEAFVVADRDYYPELQHLQESLPRDHIRWHVWQRAEIENYLLCPDAIIRLLRSDPRQMALEEPDFRREYERLVELSKDSANDHLVEAYNEYRRRREEKWDAAAMSRMAREYLKQHWESEQTALADAKETVLPGIKRWLQEHRLGQFSNKALAEALRPADLPAEVHELARRLADFAGVAISDAPPVS